MQKFLHALAVLFILTSCSSGGDEDPVQNNAPTGNVLTTPIYNLGATTAMSGGTVSGIPAGSITAAGVCYATWPNPTIDDAAIAEGVVQNGAFNAYLDHLIQEATYYVRSFVTYNGTTIYGNEVMFSIPALVTVNHVKNITLKTAQVTYTIPDGVANIGERGLLYSTSPNPGLGSLQRVGPNHGQPGTFTIELTGLSSNVTYYVRAYVIHDFFEYSYSEVMEFKTPGGEGPAGGRIFFDKGEHTDGWRYLEAAPYGFDSAGITFGCNGTFIGGTSTEMGSGPANTAAIIAGCSDPNSGAALCSNAVINGFDDWFLPSIEEAKVMYKLKNSVSLYPDLETVSSSEISETLYWQCGIVPNTHNVVDFNELKTKDEYKAWPVRRY